MDIWPEISAHVAVTTGRKFVGGEPQSVLGGCINAAHVIHNMHDEAQRFFVKTKHAAQASRFAAEAEGLLELAKATIVRVPEPICWGAVAGTAYLVLEYVEFGQQGERTSATFGAQLAQLHHITTSRFGWYRDNTIGSTLQRNTYTASWVEFWCEHRLGFQLQLIRGNGYYSALSAKLERVLAGVPMLLAGHKPQPALLHGDLWGGNVAADSAGRPVIFDPALYYGDRETDVAMTELFGGFGPYFYQSYKSAYPLTAGYTVRKTLYNLYHVLNHVNLFGGGYASQAERMAEKLLSELR